MATDDYPGSTCSRELFERSPQTPQADVPLLLLRFVLQPLRVLVVAIGTYRARQMQSRVRELRVDFDTLPANGMAFESMTELT